jgi:acyl dehydratase
MPISSSTVGAVSPPHTADIDARWTMAYAAALGEFAPCYMDTRDAEHFVAHPMFAVCFEWPVVSGVRLEGVTLAEARRGVHASHDLIIARPIRPPEQLTTRATVVSVRRTRAGAHQVTRLETLDSSGSPVCTTHYGSIYRGVDVSGPDTTRGALPDPLVASRQPPEAMLEDVIHVGAGLAHIYTECARIWNPIHTDIKVAQDAGLPDLILHGTATLALAVSRIVALYAGGDPRPVARIAGRFKAMVLMPSDITLRVFSREPHQGGHAIFFDVLNATGEPAITQGAVAIR